MQLDSLSTRRRRASRCVERLKTRYGSPRLNNKQEPLDELVFIVLSQMTTSPSYERVFERLKAAVPEWGILTEVSVSTVTSLIADAGLSNQRAVRLKLIADRLSRDFGEVSLAGLAGYDDETVQRYLTSLPGVGVKTAKCVMMYSMGRQVLPVDTHTGRVAVRLGLVSEGSAVMIDRSLSAVVPADRRFDFPRQCCRPRPRHVPCSETTL